MLKDEVKAFSDMEANLDTREVAALKRKLSGLKPDEVKPFIEDLTLGSMYMHGTHVAGLLYDESCLAGKDSFRASRIEAVQIPTKGATRRTNASS